MSFWDTYKEPTGSWIKADEKRAICEAGIPLPVVSVTEGEYQGEKRYVVQVLLDDAETGEEQERLLGFAIGTVDSRDRLLAALGEYLERPDAEEVKVKLEKQGKAYLLRKA